jgi:hypothetical protein
MPLRGTQGLKISFGILYALLVVAAAIMIGYGVVRDTAAWTLSGIIALVLVATTAPVALVLTGVYGRLRDTAPSGRELAGILEHTMLSDNAKRVLFRERELQLLRDAIEEDIARGDYNAAITLCDEMANLFGYREEAEAFRSRIAQARQEQYELEVEAAADQLDASLAERNWAAVHQQAARIRRLYPDSHLVGDLDRRIQMARDEHKRELEARFLEAARNDDLESAMGLLKQLDRYLTRDEAGRLTEVAKGVIVRHRDDLGGRFRQAVAEHRWSQAARLGEMIISEFPNTQMAAEVRSMLEVLRTKSGQAAVAADETE